MNSVRVSEMRFNELVMLMAFLPLLGATSHVATAIIAGIVGVVTTGAVWLVARTGIEKLGETVRWAILVATGLTVPYVLTAGAQFLVPLPPSSTIYLYLVGVTPMVYLGVRSDERVHAIVPVLVRYILLMVAFALVRELLGHGSLLSYAIPGLDGQPPIGFLASNAGALLVFAVVMFGGQMIPSTSRSASASITQRTTE